MKTLLEIVVLMIVGRMLFHLIKRNIVVRTICVLIKSVFLFLRYSFRMLATDYRTAKKYLSRMESKYKKATEIIEEQTTPVASITNIESKITEALERIEEDPQDPESTSSVEQLIREALEELVLAQPQEATTMKKWQPRLSGGEFDYYI